jgi:Tfp pilus assembly ATPase PilU
MKGGERVIAGDDRASYQSGKASALLFANLPAGIFRPFSAPICMLTIRTLRLIRTFSTVRMAHVPLKPLVAIVGATGTGKSDVSAATLTYIEYG